MERAAGAVDKGRTRLCGLLMVLAVYIAWCRRVGRNASDGQSAWSERAIDRFNRVQQAIHVYRI
jgi:hypothetical protein